MMFGEPGTDKVTDMQHNVDGSLSLVINGQQFRLGKQIVKTIKLDHERWELEQFNYQARFASDLSLMQALEERQSRKVTHILPDSKKYRAVKRQGIVTRTLSEFPEDD